MTTNFVTLAALLAGLAQSASASTMATTAPSVKASASQADIKMLADAGDLDLGDFFAGGHTDTEFAI